MIYALQSRTVSLQDRKLIAESISSGSSVEQWVQAKFITHIADSCCDTCYFCVYCVNSVRAADRNRPKTRVPVHNWYFEHEMHPGCVGTDLGISGCINPANHGCYIQLGCENNIAGLATNWHRTCCKTIESGLTYCHLGKRQNCVT